MGAPHEEALAGGAAQGSKAYETTDAGIVAPETIGGKKVHPVANMFPLLDPDSDQFKKLVVSIKHNKLWEPIVLDSEGRILDGRNRARACEAAGVAPKFVQFADLQLGLNKDGKPVDEAEYACEKNFARRDLTPDQRVMITALYSEYLDAIDRGAPKGNKNAAKKQGDQTVPAKAEPKTRAKLAAKANVSERKAQQALNVGRKKPDLAKKVAAGKMKLSEAAKQAEPKKPKRAPPAQMDLTGLPPPATAHAAVGPKNGDVIAHLIASGKWAASGEGFFKRLVQIGGEMTFSYYVRSEENLHSENWGELEPDVTISNARLDIEVRVTRAEALDGFRKLEVALNRAVAVLEGAR